MRTPVSGVSIVGRNTQGVTLIKTRDDEKIVALQRIEEVKELPVYESEDESPETQTEESSAQQGELPEQALENDDTAE